MAHSSDEYWTFGNSNKNDNIPGNLKECYSIFKSDDTSDETSDDEGEIKSKSGESFVDIYG